MKENLLAPKKHSRDGILYHLNQATVSFGVSVGQTASVINSLAAAVRFDGPPATSWNQNTFSCLNRRTKTNAGRHRQ